MIATKSKMSDVIGRAIKRGGFATVLAAGLMAGHQASALELGVGLDKSLGQDDVASVGAGASVGSGGVGAGAGASVGPGGVGGGVCVGACETAATQPPQPGTPGTPVGIPGLSDGIDGVLPVAQPAAVNGRGTCSKGGNSRAFDGVAVYSTSGELLGWVHESVITEDHKLHAVKMQSNHETVGRTACFHVSDSFVSNGVGLVTRVSTKDMAR